ncbi:MAG: CDP-glycerol glycerophosphotransferase family protein, partial [Acidimicrobiia bacterium]
MRVLFTGYAPVHFLCFKPIYDHLSADPGVEVEVSGGTRSKSEYALGGYVYDYREMYRHFTFPDGVVTPVGHLAGRDYDVMFAANSRRIEPRRVGRRVQIFHGMSFRNRAVRPETDGADHYFLLGPYMKRAFHEAGILAPDDPRGVDIGFPKTDRLLDGSLDRRTELERHGVTGERPVLLYAPTGEKRNSLETMGEELITRLGGAGDFDLLVKLHDHPHTSVDWAARLAPLENDHVRLVRHADVVASLFIADLLITDASSVANEFALLDRPIVFLDVPELVEITVAKGARIDLDTWGRKGGRLSHNPASAVKDIEACLSDPSEHSDVRRALVADMFFNPGRATAAAMTWIERELVTQVTVTAAPGPAAPRGLA